jgi:hypothetical protein
VTSPSTSTLPGQRDSPAKPSVLSSPAATRGGALPVATVNVPQGASRLRCGERGQQVVRQAHPSTLSTCRCTTSGPTTRAVGIRRHATIHPRGTNRPRRRPRRRAHRPRILIVVVHAPCSCATATMLSVLVSPCSNAQVTRTRRLGTVLSEAHEGRDVAAFGDSPILAIR